MLFDFSSIFSGPLMATVEKIAGIAGLFVIAYIIVSSLVSLFRPSPTPPVEPVITSESMEEVETQSVEGTSIATPETKRKNAGTRSAFWEIAETIVMTILIFAAVRLLVQNFRIEGNGMETNLHNGQYLIIEKVSYRFGEPQRGDIIVFHYPNNPERDFIKRIIGVPGETVEIRQSQIYIEGKALPEPYYPNQGTYNWGPGIVGEDEYFVLGDNRNNSSDSHSWGMLPRDLIVGRAWFTYWPTSAWGLIPHYTFTENLSGSAGPDKIGMTSHLTVGQPFEIE